MVVGGGPAGSTCARVLRTSGWDVTVIDRARFPRDKVCAGWVTPQVFQLLDLEPAEYRAAGLTCEEIVGFRTGLLGGPLDETRYPTPVSFAIRRCEFDHHLLDRAQVRVLDETPLERLERHDGYWTVNDAVTAPVVIGAGGHFCPVARQTRRGAEPPAVIAKEVEFRPRSSQATWLAGVPELFFCHDLGGYGWCVPKGPYLNVGLGHRDPARFRVYFAELVHILERRGAFDGASELRWRGHAYLAEGAGARPLVGDGLLVAGDAAGLAYPASGEGICPAVESGRLAAEALIAANGQYDREALGSYALALRRRYPPPTHHRAPLRAARTALGRLLLGSTAFTRHVLLDRLFLRRTHAAS